MFTFNTKRLTSGRKEVEEIIELAESIGVGIIKVTGKKYGHAAIGIANFEVGKWGYNGRGQLSGATTDVGYLYLYPDKHGQRWGFVLDTPDNRNRLAGHIASPILKIADKQVEQELIAYCDDNGINTVPVVAASPYIKKSINEERLEDKANKLESELRRKQREIDMLLEDKENVDKALISKAKYRADGEDVTVTEVQYDETTDEPVEVEVPAVSQESLAEVKKKAPAPKKDKPLAGKKAKPKA